jgi:hypothetical protein
MLRLAEKALVARIDVRRPILYKTRPGVKVGLGLTAEYLTHSRPFDFKMRRLICFLFSVDKS